MNKLSIPALLVVPLVVAANVSVAGDLPNVKKPLDPKTGFALLVQLEGTWAGEAVEVPAGETKEEGEKIAETISFKSIAYDTSVIATIAEGTDQEMVSVFHMDGPNDVVHTHYCAARNQPTMRYVKSDEPGLLRFEFSSGTNMDAAKDGHVHDSSIRFIDADTIEMVSDFWAGGKSVSVRYRNLKRKK